jgi:hypothetical protein
MGLELVQGAPQCFQFPRVFPSLAFNLLQEALHLLNLFQRGLQGFDDLLYLLPRCLNELLFRIALRGAPGRRAGRSCARSGWGCRLFPGGFLRLGFGPGFRGTDGCWGTLRVRGGPGHTGLRLGGCRFSAATTAASTPSAPRARLRFLRYRCCRWFGLFVFSCHSLHLALGRCEINRNMLPHGRFLNNCGFARSN